MNMFHHFACSNIFLDFLVILKIWIEILNKFRKVSLLLLISRELSTWSREFLVSRDKVQPFIEQNVPVFEGLILKLHCCMNNRMEEIQI